MSFPRYPKYKDSGLEWLGEIPEHWRIGKIKHFASIRYGIGEPPKYHDAGTPLIRATNIHEGKLIQNGMVFVDPHDIPEQRIVWLETGDIIVVRSGAYTGDSAILPPEFGSCIAGFDMVLKCHSVHSKLMQFCLLSRYLKEGQIDLEKMRAAQPHLNAEELGSCILALPENEQEQIRICNFLDRETGKIDELVAEQRRLIELLKEKRQAVISHAVTKGLNPDAPMKPSGIEWIGDIPANWNIVKLKTLSTNQTASFTNGPFGSDLLTSEIENEGVPVIYIRDLKANKYIRTSFNYVSFEKAKQLCKFHVDGGDILIAKVGDPPGFCCVYPLSELQGIICQDVIRMKPDNELISPNYFCFLLNSDTGMEAVNSICVELTRKRFSLADLQDLRLPIPSRSEQEEIVKELEKVASDYDALSLEAEQAIELLQERRAALISAAVTGQIDVRGFAERETA